LEDTPSYTDIWYPNFTQLWLRPKCLDRIYSSWLRITFIETFSETRSTISVQGGPIKPYPLFFVVQ